MRFINILKSNIDEKYLNLLDGKTSNVAQGFSADNVEKFTKKYKDFVSRVSKEHKKLEDSFSEIKKREKTRIVDENRRAEEERARLASEKQKQEEEAKKKRLAEEKRKKEEARRQAEEEQRRVEEEKRKREAIARAEQERKDKKERIFQSIALFCPSVLVIVTAIILFSNSTQLQIRGSFVGGLTAWVFFLLVTLITTIVFARKMYSEWEPHEKQSRIVASMYAVLSLVILIVTISVSTSTITPNFNPETFIKVSATGKTTESGYRNTSTISFSLENTSDVDIDSIEGNMDFYDGDYLISQYSVTFNGPFEAGRSYNSTVEFDEDSSNCPLYETSFNDLSITWEITDIYIDYRNYSVDSSPIQIKVSSNNTGNSSGNNSGENSDDTTLLQRFKYAVSDDVILPDNYEGILDEGHVNVYSYYDYQDYYGYYAMFEISETQQSSFLNNFLSKLQMNGYSLRTNDPFGDEYIKNNTVLQFSDVQESTTYDPSTDEYVFNGYYFNFYAFTI